MNEPLNLKVSSWVDHAATTSMDQSRSKQQKVEMSSLVAFSVGTENYAVPIENVKEVVPTPHISPLPQSPDFVRGVVNVRGNVLAIVDAHYKKEQQPTPEGGFVIILKDDQFRAGLLVHQVPQTLILPSAQINRSASVLKSLSENERYIVGLVKHEDKMIFLVDLKSMLTY